MNSAGQYCPTGEHGHWKNFIGEAKCPQCEEKFNRMVERGILQVTPFTAEEREQMNREISWYKEAPPVTFKDTLPLFIFLPLAFMFMGISIGIYLGKTEIRAQAVKTNNASWVANEHGVPTFTWKENK